MKILFDYQVFTFQKYGGISRYIANLYSHLNQVANTSAKIGLLYSNNYYIKKLFPIICSNWKARIFKGRSSRMTRYNKRYSKWTILFRNFDVFHPSYYDPYFIPFVKRKKVVITVHDMIHELFPEYFPDAEKITAYKKQCVNRADAIIAISEQTKKDLIAIFQISSNKIHVIHHGIEKKQHIIKQNKPFFSKKYLLFVGERWTYKNFLGFLEGIIPLLQADKALHLVCAGGGGFSNNELTTFSNVHILDQCHQFSVDDTTLDNLYQYALCFCFPSYYEGFGLPILEAFQNECPIALSNTSCFPEIAEDAAIYFDPNDRNDIFNKIKGLVYNDALQNILRKKGVAQLKKFSFEDCLQKTHELYKEITQQ